MAKPRYLPYGYRIQNGLITPDTAQAEYVRQIYQLYLAGNSLQEIAKHLQANSIPYSDETGWNKNTVHRIVKNPAYCGKDRYPPIVEYTLFQKAQVLCQRKAPTYTEALKDIRGDIICPECGSKLIRFEGEAAHYCPNETACPPQIKGKIEHFISRKAMNIDGLGPETVDMFYRLGLIKDTADLYQLKTDDIKNLERMGEKSAENIVNGIAASKEVPFERVLFALGIRFVGETVAKKIAKSFTDIEELENADLEKLKNIDEIGEKIAQSIITYFSNPANRELVERLKSNGLQLHRTEEDLSGYTDKLAGQSIVISGVFTHHSRDEYKEMIEKNGGKNVGSISSKTSFILAGENMGPAKLEKAQKLGVKIMSEDEFLALLS